MQNYYLTLPGVARRAAERFADALAVADGEVRLSFHELDEQVERATAAFVAAGLRPGERVGIWAPNRLKWILACLGAQAAQGVVVPLNTRLKGIEAQFILNRAKVRILMVSPRFLNIDYQEELAGLELPHLRRRVVLDAAGWTTFLAAAGPDDLAEAQARRQALRGEDASDILFTSGTSGQPKGVITGHGQSVQVFQTWVERVGLREGDRYLIVNPFFHTFGYKAGWLACLLAGAAIYPEPLLDVARMTARIAAERITVLPGAPTLFQSLLARTGGAAEDLSSLRLAVTGAANVPPLLIERMRGELGIDTVLTGYGLTESCGVVTLSEAGDSAERVAAFCGRAIPGVELRCVDGQMQDVPLGEVGEVVLRGFNVMQGYLDDPAGTAAAIDAHGWLHTGDIGRLDAQGYLQITDRIKDMYISGGFNCYPAEIERIMAGHAQIAQAAVIGVADARMGEVGLAFVILRPGAALDEAELLEWCRRAMANYKAPRAIRFCPEFPVNASGKVLKTELRRIAAGS